MIAPQGGPPSIGKGLFLFLSLLPEVTDLLTNLLSLAVPTHFAKVILASRTPSSTLALIKPSSSSSDRKEWVQGAFVLPNEPIPDQTRLEGFVVPVESVERAAGLNLLPEDMKGVRELCKVSFGERRRILSPFFFPRSFLWSRVGADSWLIAL
jgi:DNA/RNA endonuclease G (NUC1)